MPVTTNPGSKLHVLLIEDEQEVRESLAEILTDMEIFSTVVQAIDGKDGLNKYQKQNFDLIITDLAMPKVSGIEVIRNLYNDKLKAPPPVIILSGSLTGMDVQKAIKLGVKYVLVKPCTEEQIVGKVEEVLANDVGRKVMII